VRQSQVAVTDIIIDCSDPGKLARFWCSLLLRPIEGRKGPYVWLVRAPGAAGFGFQKVEEQKRGKNRVHIDVSGSDVTVIKRKVTTQGVQTTSTIFDS
jgi:hypothetical protein